VFSGVFIAEDYEEVDEVRDKRSGDITTVDVHTPGGLFDHILESLTCVTRYKQLQCPYFS
jgi:hypothetical protein